MENDLNFNTVNEKLLGLKLQMNFYTSQDAIASFLRLHKPL